MLWWALVHALLGAAVLALGVSKALTIALAGAIAAHGLARRPRAPRRLVLDGDGRWAVPEEGLAGLRLAPGTAWTTWYVELVFEGRDARVRVLLLRDQLGAEQWRRLQLVVREHDDCDP